MKKMNMFNRVAMLSLLFALGCMASGCNQGTDGGNADETSNTTTRQDDSLVEVDDHSGWWCAPHGVPEEECSMCSASAAAKFKEKGDWCEEHNRAKSQCFICDPSLADKYVKLYEAKFGKQPPPRAE